MSVSMSRKLELGFETGFSAFFLHLFASQLYKIKWFLLPIALVFCSIIIILRHYYSESGVQSGSITPNAYHPVGVGPPNATVRVIDISGEDSNVERRDSPSNGQVSEESALVGDNEQNNEQEEPGSSSPATHHFPSNNGEVSEGSRLDGDNEQNNEEEGDRSSLAAESSGNKGVTIQIDRMHSFSESESILREGLRHRFPWSPEEDEALQKLVEKHGPRNWFQISQSIPGRSGKACRLQWCKLLSRQVERVTLLAGRG